MRLLLSIQLTFNDIELISAASKTDNSLAKVLGQNLQSTICFLSTDEYFAHCQIQVYMLSLNCRDCFEMKNRTYLWNFL